MKQKWIPLYEPSNWMDLETTIISWSPPLKIGTCMVEKVVAHKEIFIPKAMTFHLLQYMANQSKAINNEHFESNRHVLEGNDLK